MESNVKISGWEHVKVTTERVTFQTNNILIYLLDLTGIYEMMYRSKCFSFWGM